MKPPEYCKKRQRTRCQCGPLIQDTHPYVTAYIEYKDNICKNFRYTCGPFWKTTYHNLTHYPIPLLIPCSQKIYCYNYHKPCQLCPSDLPVAGERWAIRQALVTFVVRRQVAGWTAAAGRRSASRRGETIEPAEWQRRAPGDEVMEPRPLLSSDDPPLRKP